MPQRFQPHRFMRALGSTLGDMATQASLTQLISQAAARYGLDPAFVMGVARRESNLNPNAVSPAGAKGVMQLMDGTALMLGVTNVFDAAQNINAGTKYLAQLLNQYAGDVAKALAAYDWGPGNLSKAIAQWGNDWLAHAPAETRDYVAAISGITPNTPAAPSSPGDSAPLTIDANTGEVIADAPNLPQASAPQISTGMILGLTGAALAAYLIADFFSE